MTSDPTDIDHEVGGISDALGAKAKPVSEMLQVLEAVVQFANGEIRPAPETRFRPRSPTARQFDKVTAALSDTQHQLMKELAARFPARNPDVTELQSLTAEAHRRADMKWEVWNDEADDYVPADTEEARVAAEKQIDFEIEFTRHVLAKAAEGVGPLVESLRRRPFGPKMFSLIRMVPAPTIKADSIQMAWRLTGPGSAALPWVAFAGSLLGSSPRGRMTDVGRCQLESCGRFFLIDWNEGNRPRTKYCCPEHRLEQNKLGATKRKQESRRRAEEARSRHKAHQTRKPK